MNLFFKCNFTKPHKDASLISIGIVSEDGKEFYAEFIDFDISQCSEWVKENIVKNLVLTFPTKNADIEITKNTIQEWEEEGYKLSKSPFRSSGYVGFCTSITKDSITEVVGDKEWIANELKDWLEQFGFVNFISDLCHYDFVFLIDLFGSEWDLPFKVSSICHDINYDIANYYRISEEDASNRNRGLLLFDISGAEISGKKHNALYDAKVIKKIYECIQRNMEIEDE